MTVRKTAVTLGGVPLAADSSISWAFTVGTTAYRTAFTVPKKHWPKIESKIGSPQQLLISDRSRTVRINNVYILHQLPSDSPARVTFEVADKRIWWEYPTISRDYNLAKKTGNRITLKNAPKVETPSAAGITADQYDYREYTLKDAESRWTAQDAVKDVMDQLEPEGWVLDGFPIKDDGQFSLQNVMLHDPGDVALGRLLGFIPGAQVYINAAGKAVVFDGADLGAAERQRKNLPPLTFAGDFPVLVRRKAIRPSEIKVMYQREVEAVFHYSETTGHRSRNHPWVDNVIPTTDPVTDITHFDPIAREDITVSVPAGTWVPVDKWLDAMEELRTTATNVVGWPWTRKTIHDHWIKGNLDGAFGARNDGTDLQDTDTRGSIQARVNALKQNYRQTFQINRGFMERIQDISAIRAAILNPMTGLPSQAAAWGQITIVPTAKGEVIAQRFNPDKTGVFMLMDTLPGRHENGPDLIDNPPLPLKINMLDPDLGIFQITFQTAAYGTDKGFYPCHLKWSGSGSTPKVHGRDLEKQDDEPMGGGVKIEGGTNAELLADTMEMKFMLSIVPGAPNNKTRYHTETVKASDIKELYRSEYRIQGGEGPPMEVFIPPGEQAARFQWVEDDVAENTLSVLLGLNSDDPNSAGLPPDDPKTGTVDESAMNGFLLANDGDQKGGRHLKGHAMAVAAEVIASYADSLQGTVSTRLPNIKSGAPWLAGNMSSATIDVASYPTGEVSTVHDFPGQQAPISRMATMPEMVRQLVLGIIPYRKAGK